MIRVSPLNRPMGLVSLASAIFLLISIPSFGADLTNTASVTNDTGFTNESTAISQIRIRTDFALDVSVYPNPIFFGTSMTVTLNIENLGPSNSNGFSVELRVPAEVTFDSSPNNCSPDTGGAVCGLGNLPVGSTEFSVVFSFPAEFAGPVDLSVEVFPDDIDPVSENDNVLLSIPIEDPFFFDTFEDGTTDAWSAVFSAP